MLLPMEDCESGPLQEMYINLVREFGTHYTTEVVMGAKAVQQLTFSKSDLSKLESEGISAKVKKPLKLLEFTFMFTTLKELLESNLITQTNC